MSVYTVRFAAGYGQERAAAPPVPAGKVWVVRCADFVPGGGAASEVGLSVDDTFAFFLGMVGVEPNLYHLQWQGRQALTEGEVLGIYLSVACQYSVTGYELDV